MEVSVETTQGLERKMTVQVPAQRVEDEVDNRLKKLRGQVRLDGFRPGKVPLKVVQKRYGPQVRNEVVSEILERSYGEALEQEGLRPAGQPQIEPVNMEEGGDIKYQATFEVLPPVEVGHIDEIQVERPSAEITDADIDSVIDRLRKQHAEFAPVERAAAEGDRVTFDFEGTIDGEAFEGNASEDVVTEIGSGQMPEGFEQQLIGVKTGNTPVLEFTFPEEFPDEQIAGKTATFNVTIKNVEEAQLPELDDSFAEQLGLEGGVEELRNRVQQSLESERDQAVRSQLKRQVMDELVRLNPIDLPQTLIDGEIEQLREQTKQQMRQYGQDPEQMDWPAEHFEEEARRRVSLGLLVNEIVRLQELQLDQQRLQQALQQVAANSRDPQQVLQDYQQDRQKMQNLEVQVMEDQVVDWILERAQITDKPMSFDEAMGRAATANQEG
jgi:trigger factor